jgi:hypothetical protein
MKKAEQSTTVVYQTKAGAIELNQDIKADTVWATQADIADIFDSERSVITKHIRNILKDRELNADSVCAKMARTADDTNCYFCSRILLYWFEKFSLLTYFIYNIFPIFRWVVICLFIVALFQNTHTVYSKKISQQD